MGKWGLILKALAVAAVVVGVKALVDYIGFNVIALSSLVTALVGGVIFTIAIILSGVLVDYKESEKIPGELAASIKTLYKDSSLICMKDKKMRSNMQSHIKKLLNAITTSFRRNKWNFAQVVSAIDSIDDDISDLADKEVAPPFLVKLRNELTNIEKLSNRIQTITETTFLPAAYGIAQLGVFAMIAILLFVRIDPAFEGLALVGATSALLFGLILLIKDMDNPFETGKGTYADVDLSHLFNLEDYLERKGR